MPEAENNSGYTPYVQCLHCSGRGPDVDSIAHVPGCETTLAADHAERARPWTEGEERFFEWHSTGHPVEGRRSLREIAPPNRHEMEGASCYECGGIGGHSTACIRGGFAMARAGEELRKIRESREIAPPSAPAELKRTMAERNSRYGDFKTQAKFGEAIRFVFEISPNWQKLSPSMRLSLLWISDKVSRILCGDFNYRDSWHDVAGYASLIERELQA